MEVLMSIVAVAIAVLLWQGAYKSGKREGSRKGYGVGYDRGRRSKNQSGCLVVLVAVGMLVTAASMAIACFP